MGELVCPCIVSFKKGKSHYDSYPFFMYILSDNSLVANFSIREELWL